MLIQTPRSAARRSAGKLLLPQSLQIVVDLSVGRTHDYQSRRPRSHAHGIAIVALRRDPRSGRSSKRPKNGAHDLTKVLPVSLQYCDVPTARHMLLLLLTRIPPYSFSTRQGVRKPQPPFPHPRCIPLCPRCRSSRHQRVSSWSRPTALRYSSSRCVAVSSCKLLLCAACTRCPPVASSESCTQQSTKRDQEHRDCGKDQACARSRAPHMLRERSSARLTR